MTADIAIDLIDPDGNVIPDIDNGPFEATCWRLLACGYPTAGTSLWLYPPDDGERPWYSSTLDTSASEYWGREPHETGSAPVPNT